MAPGRKRGVKGLKSNNELSLGDLVLAKVKGFPAWPARISRPEDWERAPDAKKYFVQFFGTSEIAFVAPADIQVFTSETKSKLYARCQGKKIKNFAQAVTEICEEFELLQQQSSSGVRGDNNTLDLASTGYADSVEDENLEGAGNNEMGSEGLVIKSEIRSLGCTGSRSLGGAESQDSKDYPSEDMESLSPHVSLQKTNKLSSNPGNLVKETVVQLRKGEASRGTDVEDECSDGGPKESTIGHQSMQGMGQKRKRDGTVRKNSGLDLSQEHKDGVETNFASDCSIKESSVDDIVLGLPAGRRNKNLLKEKLLSDGAVNVRRDANGKAVGKNQNVPRNKEKPLRGHESYTAETGSPNMSRRVDSVDGSSSIVRNQTSRKIDAKALIIQDNKITNIPSKRFSLGGEAEKRLTSNVQTIDNEPRPTSDEDDVPPTKRYHKVQDRMSTPASLSESKRRNLASRMNESIHPNVGRSPVTQLPAKRRAVRICEDDGDELPKTPIHGGVANKVSVTPRLSDSKKQTNVRGENNLHDQQRGFRNSGTVNDVFRKQAQPIRASNKALSTTAHDSMKKKTIGMLSEHMSPSAPRPNSDKLAVRDARSTKVSPKRSPLSMRTMLSSERQNKSSSKAPSSTGVVVQTKFVEGSNRVVLSASDQSSSFFSQSMSEKSKVATSGEKRNMALDSLIKDASVPGNADVIIASPGLRQDLGKPDKINFPVASKNPESDVSMKNLIAAAAQARKRQAYLQNSSRNPFPFLAPDAELTGGTPSPNLRVVSSNILRVDARPTSPSSDTRQISLIKQHDNGEFEERRTGSVRQANGSPLSGGTDAAVARDAFEGMIETLSRTKESIGRATRLAIDCAKYGIANEVVELLIRKLESEASLHRRVDLFFLVDSITQCSHSQKGIAGASYIPAVQAAVPRIIAAAAPPGAGAQENRRQCYKVLRLWLERKILPEFILRRHMTDIGASNDDASAGLSLRRPSRAERAFDDPIREMEGMLVDEYGSNATFQLPGLMTSHIFDDEEEEDEDDIPTKLSNEIVDTPPSQQTPASRDTENQAITPNERHRLVLEDVDGELEMEDVSGDHHDTSVFPNGPSDTFSSIESNANRIIESASNLSKLLPSPECSPPFPLDTPPEIPPLPSSPWPFAPPPQPTPLLPVSYPPPPPPPPSSQQYLHPPPSIGPPLFVSQPLVPPQPTLISQHRPPLQNTLAHPQPFPYPPPPLPHEVGRTPVGNQFHNMASQQAPFLPPAAAASIPHEHAFYNSSRPVEYGNFQALPPWQPYHPSGAPFAQRPLRPEPAIRAPSHLSYPNDALQHQLPPYSLPNFPNGPRGHPYHHEGSFGIPQERPLTIAVNFHPSASKAGSSVVSSSDRGVHMVPSRPDMSNGHWRPA